MSYRPKIKGSDGGLVELPIDAETLGGSSLDDIKALIPDISGKVDTSNVITKTETDYIHSAELGDSYIPSTNFLRYWNGNITGGTSNLLYCNRGTIAALSDIPSGDSLWNSGSTTWAGNNNITCSGSGVEWSFDVNDTGNNEGAYWHVWSSNLGNSMLACYPSSGRVAITYNLSVGGSITASSDRNLKEDIKAINNIDLSSLLPYTYYFKSDKEKTTRIGLIAQEVKLIYPEAVKVEKLKKTDELGLNEHLSLDYNAIVALLVGKVNELEKRIIELEKH